MSKDESKPVVSKSIMKWTEDMDYNLFMLYFMTESDDFPMMALSLLLKSKRGINKETQADLQNQIHTLRINKEILQNKVKKSLRGRKAFSNHRKSITND